MNNQPNKTTTSSVQTRVILTTLLALTLILSCFTAYQHWTLRNGQYNNLKVSTDIAATRLAATLSIPLWDLDRELISETLISEMLNENIIALVLRDSDTNKIFVAKQRDGTGKVVDVESDVAFVQDVVTRTSFQAQKEVAYDGEVIGQIEVYISSHLVDLQLQKALFTTIASVLVLDMSIFLLLLLLLRSLIIKPIMSLSRSVERMSRGELNIELDFSRRDEIGLVAQAIERMQVSLRIAMGRLNQEQGKSNV